MRKSWTDARLDAFAEHTDNRFDALERHIETGFNRVDAELRGINVRFDALQKTTIQTSALVIVALIGLIATQL
jgi:hypothetical protein